MKCRSRETVTSGERYRDTNGSLHEVASCESLVDPDRLTRGPCGTPRRQQSTPIKRRDFSFGFELGQFVGGRAAHQGPHTCSDGHL